MKKFFKVLTVAACTLGFASCSSSDDPTPAQESTLVGTWYVEETQTKEEGLYDGSVKINWACSDDATISIPMEGQTIPMKIKDTIVPLACNMGNTYLPQVLNSVTFTADGKIVALYKKIQDESTTRQISNPEGWLTAEGYATYKVQNENLIIVYLDQQKIQQSIQDAEDQATLGQLFQFFNGGIPIHIQYNADKSKAYFYVDKNYALEFLKGLDSLTSQIPSGSLDADTLQTIVIFKALVGQITTVLDASTTFEAGIELEKK